MSTAELRISEAAFKGVCGVLFGIAITGAISRTALRFHNTSRLTADDGFLFVACVALIAATGILYRFVPGAYLFEVFAFHPPSVLPPGFDFDKTVVYNVKLLDAYNVLSWVVIYSVKFCFLSFFRSLIDRVQKMVVYWRVVVGITAVFFVLSLCETFIACPRVKPSSYTCLQGPGVHRTLAIAATTKSLDITTDLLIISIPISLLWNVKIKARQKLGVGVFLCLSIFMIILAIIKASGLKTSVDSFALVWEIFWQQVEASAAVLMVSFTAFRSVFVSNAPNTKRKRSYSSARRLFGFLRKRSTSDPDSDPSSQKLEMGPPLTLGTGFRRARNMGLGRTQFGDESETNRIESVYIQPDTKGSAQHSESVFVPSDQSGLSNSRTSHDRLWNGRGGNNNKRKSRHWWDIGTGSSFTNFPSVV